MWFFPGRMLLMRIWVSMNKGKELLLQVDGASVCYGAVQALDSVTVALDEGEIVALMGPNGSGKSTILKTIFGLVPMRSGKVLWHGLGVSPVSHEMVERGVAFVPQGRLVFESLTVKENLEVGGFTVRNAKIVAQRIEMALDLFPDLKKKLDVLSGSLSGGQQQMLAFARGLMTDPKVLLLDEPSLGLSPKIVTEVFAKIQEINREYGTAIMVVEHNISALLGIAHRGYVLDRGKVVQSDSAQAIREGGVLGKVFVGAAD